MRAPQERWARLVERHPRLTVVNDPDGRSDQPDRSAVVVGRELLVPAADVDRVDSLLRQGSPEREDLTDLQAARFRLRDDRDLAELIATELSSAGEPLAYPVHMFRGEPRYQGGPASEPAVPAEEVPGPPQRRTGTPVTVAVLDTGLDGRHPWFPPSSWDAVDGDDVSDRLDEDNDYQLDAQAGHGTFVAGVLRRSAPAARLLVGRVLGSDGVCDEVELARAIRRLGSRARSAGRRVDVLNLSLGAYTWDDRPPKHVADALAALGAGTVVVAAAGNNGSDRVFWPAALPDVTAVGATGAAGSGRAGFSNHGPWVDAWAPGEHVASSFVTFDGPEPPRCDIDPDCFRGYATWSGTSFAAPGVSGAIAARAQEHRTSARDQVAGVCADFGGPGGGAGGP
jgi:subtilisin family serine protease